MTINQLACVTFTTMIVGQLLILAAVRHLVPVAKLLLQKRRTP